MPLGEGVAPVRLRAYQRSRPSAIENRARELDVQYLLGHSTSAMVRRYAATYDAAKAAAAHASFSPAARLLTSEDAAG